MNDVPHHPRRVLILCTGNSCRSQMAEALWRELGADEWECHSAGSRPTGSVHPLALTALRHDGVPFDDARSKSVTEFDGQRFDLVVTVCDNAREDCPVFPGSPTEHWPFFDPAEAEGDRHEQLDVFEVVREQIRRRIEAYLGVDTAIVLRTWIEQLITHRPGGLADERRSEYIEIVDRLVAAWDDPWARLPNIVRETMSPRGGEWNGIYRLDATGRRLTLMHAAGPPVCATLERRGGVGTSGMCFDAVITQQPIASGSPHDWPGYVSCDGMSGLETRTGFAVPIRNRGGDVVAVWDLDCTRALESSDLWFFPALLSSLALARALTTSPEAV